MSDRQRTDYRARRMGFVFQFYNLMPVLTPVENVELPLLVAARHARRRRGSRRWRRSNSSGFATGRSTCPDELSGGQRQRVTIARALVNDPAIVWADEPTGDLDSENADEIVELMRRLNREHGLTFVIVTHDIGVGRKTDRIVRMVDGHIVNEEVAGGEVNMVARATLAEIDPSGSSIDDAVELFRESVVPALHEQDGYEGVYVLLSDGGQGARPDLLGERGGR